MSSGDKSSPIVCVSFHICFRKDITMSNGMIIEVVSSRSSGEWLSSGDKSSPVVCVSKGMTRVSFHICFRKDITMSNGVIIEVVST